MATSFCKGVNYLLDWYGTEEVIAETHTDIVCFTPHRLNDAQNTPKHFVIGHFDATENITNTYLKGDV